MYTAVHSIKMMGCGIPVFLLYSFETNDCGKLLLCRMLVHVPTTKCQESSAVQEMAHHCSISWKKAGLLSDDQAAVCTGIQYLWAQNTEHVCIHRQIVPVYGAGVVSFQQV